MRLIGGVVGMVATETGGAGVGFVTVTTGVLVGLGRGWVYMGAPPHVVNSLGQESPSKIGVMKDSPAHARKSGSGQWSVGPI